MYNKYLIRISVFMFRGDDDDGNDEPAVCGGQPFNLNMYRQILCAWTWV